ncbi:MAG: VCBS repeat-containing protein [Polyangiaceae bacterium]
MRRLAFLLLLLPIAAVAGTSCDGDPGTQPTAGTGGTTTATAPGGTGGTTTATAGTGGELFDGGTGTCADGEPCEGGVCAGGVCCKADLACASACCNEGEVCSFQKCATPGATCTDSSECPPSEYCEYSLGDPAGSGGSGGGDPGCMGGANPLNGKCLPRPPICPEGQEPDPENLTCLASCQLDPPLAAFSPVVKYAWGGQVVSPFSTDVMMSPIVIELDDDDCDGKVTERDIPEILFSTFSGGAYKNTGVLHAISVVNGAVVEKWTAPGIHPTKHIAAGNIDGLPGVEVVACGFDGAVHTFHGDGSPSWSTPVATCFMPSIADLDGDGTPEVIVEDGILDGATGAKKTSFSAPLASSFVVSDIDGDSKLDIVTSSQGFHADGSLFVDTGVANQGMFEGTPDWKSPWPAVGDLDKDGKPEIVVVDNLNHQLSVWRHDPAQPNNFAIVRSPIDLNGPLSPSSCPAGSWGNTHGGGPPTIADFTGDGVPDVAMAGGVGYAVFDGKKLMDPNIAGPDTLLWIKSTFDCSSASTGSTVFDFNGDGRAEVVYSDQRYLRIYDGPTGDILFETCNTTATLIENPVVADVDNDGHADIVVVSNAYSTTSAANQCNDGVNTGQSGVRVFGDLEGKWVRTRRVWNEHAYHITNVGEDGSIPAAELPNITQPGLNNFRQNKQPGSELAAPDAIVSVSPRCGADYELGAIVRNIGEASLPAGVVVGFYSGEPGTGTLLGKATTTKVLYPAESQLLILPLPMPLETSVYGIVDDSPAPHPEWAECRTDNNTSKAVFGGCDTPQ